MIKRFIKPFKRFWLQQKINKLDSNIQWVINYYNRIISDLEYTSNDKPHYVRCKQELVAQLQAKKSLLTTKLEAL